MIDKYKFIEKKLKPVDSIGKLNLRFKDFEYYFHLTYNYLSLL